MHRIVDFQGWQGRQGHEVSFSFLADELNQAQWIEGSKVTVRVTTVHQKINLTKNPPS